MRLLKIIKNKKNKKKLYEKINNLIKMAAFYGNNISNNKLCHINTIILEGYADAEKLVVLIGNLLRVIKGKDTLFILLKAQ